MKHKNYYKFTASSNYELGVQLGKTFKDNLIQRLDKAKEDPRWQNKLSKSQAYLEPSEKYFPNLIEELKGYAEGAGADFQELWTLSLEDEFEYSEKCTTLVTNNGLLISHNEDWDAESEDQICVLEKTVNDVTIFELFYYNTLGGNSISINSYGFVQAINSLTHADWQVGIPRNVIARWFSETSNPRNDFKKFKTLPRSLGYNHILVDRKGEISNIESTSQNAELTKPHSPFVHTNHYLGENKSLEGTVDNGVMSTFNRYKKATQKVKPQMTEEELITLNSDQSDGEKMSIFNERTIAKMILDMKNKVAKVWLKREKDLGWIDYSLEEIID